MSLSPRTDSDNSEFQTNISLIARVRDRTDVESWREFYQFYHPLLTRYLRRLGLKEDTANDVIQDVFVRLLQALPKFDLDGKRGRFRSYLWKLTYSGLVDEARRVKARRQAEEEWVKRFLVADEAESRKLHQELNEINYREIVDRASAPRPGGNIHASLDLLRAAIAPGPARDPPSPPSWESRTRRFSSTPRVS